MNTPRTAAEIKTDYIESFEFTQTRKRRQVQQLVLLNNLNRGDQNIASTLLLTLFNRVLSSLYDDKMQVKFLPSQGIEQEQLNSYNILAQSDYQEMDKAKLDYDWTWDALFFGRGYMETVRFNKKRKIMEPHVINPLAFGYDPYFENVQEWRYYWKWITKGKYGKDGIASLIKSGKITGIKDISQLPPGIDPYLWEWKTQRDSAKKAVEPAITASTGDVYQILEFYGYDEDGKKCCYWLDRDISMILMKEELKFDDGEDGETKWPICVKEVFREPHSSVNFSIADLLEDKHRAESVLYNLAFIAAKDRANPLYWYDTDKITDVTQFLQRQINQHIPVTGDGRLAVGPINTEDPMSDGLLKFLNVLRSSANDPVGTGLTGQQESTQSDKTATHDAIQQQLNDMAQSLQSKIMQFGEQEFWGFWFARYAQNAKELGTKMANIVGVKGINSQMVDLKDFQTDYPPGVMVYSAKEAEYKELVKRRDWMNLFPNLQATLDMDSMRNFQKHVFLPLMIEDPSLIEVMLPKTLDEMKAEAENEQLKQDILPQVAPTDNHTTHLYVHHMVQPKTWALWFHINQHETLLAEQKAQEQMQGNNQQGGNKVSESISYKDLPPDGQAQMAQQAGIKLDANALQAAQMSQSADTKPKVGAGAKVGKDKQNPQSAAAPLKQAINPKTSIK